MARLPHDTARSLRPLEQIYVPRNAGGFYESDLNSFLTHRPVWPSALLLQKAFAGLVLYLTATGIPLVFTLAWIAVPSHFPAPFDWRMALPSTADLFGGSAFYFAGMLIGMRDARWYGSRIAGIGAPIVCSFAAHLSHEFWQAIVWDCVGILITGVAALGTFIAGAASKLNLRRCDWRQGFPSAQAWQLSWPW